MNPKLFVTYFLLLSGDRSVLKTTNHTVRMMMEYRRSEDPAFRVAYQMLVLDALKRCKYVVDVGDMLNMPEDWDTFLDLYK